MATTVNLKGVGPTLITKGTSAPSRVSSPTLIRNAAQPGGKLPYNALAKDLDSLSKNINTIQQTLATNAPTVTELLITDNQGQIVAAIGNMTYEGVYYVNFFNEIHVGNNLLTNNPKQAIFNANQDGSITVGGDGWVDVLDHYQGVAAFIGTQNDTNAITGAADNGSGGIRLTVPGHTLITGNPATVRNMQNAGVPNATGNWPSVTVIDSSHVDLDGSVWAGAYVPPPAVFGIDTTSPTIDRILQISGAANNGAGLIRLTTTIPHTYVSGDRVNVLNVGGVPNATGQWTVKIPNSTHVDLVGSTFAGAYTSGGTVLRFYAGMLAQTFATGPSFQNYTLRAFADGSLKINNATIELTGTDGSIVIDPAGPSIVMTSTGSGGPFMSLTSPAGEVLLDSSGPDILISNSANSATLKAQSNPPALILTDSLGVVVATIGVDGAGHGAVVLNGPTINGGVITVNPTVTTTATVRNAAGTGTSVFAFNANGQLVSYTP